MGLFESLIQQCNQRIQESTLSILGIADENVRKHLHNQISEEDGAEAFISEPVFEHTCGWQTTDEQMIDFADTLISREMIDNLACSDKCTFPSDRNPYVHQVKSWEHLTEKKPRSIIVTTGTGSGKTECFMIPIINDLIIEHLRIKKPLVGVRALFLYPLNALINSQQERLDSWTSRYGANIRFCLYNGNTEEKMSSVKIAQSERSNEILSRELLRKEPAPILMTNATMLEYMLVRQIDSPIIKKSRDEGSLRWIVLDEAHTYVGSQAAEISLLLRRVVQAFGKRSKDIRFIATSATIADDEGHQKLVKYLAALAGVSEEQVEVITGKRIWDTIDESISDAETTCEELASIEKEREVSEARYTALCCNKQATLLRRSFMESATPLSLSVLMKYMRSFLNGENQVEKQYELLKWLDLLCGTRKSELSQAFLPLRIHLFQRMLHGLWCCIDPNCVSKSEHLEAWPFGTIYTKQRSRCSCGAPVFELAFCKDCNAPYLIAEDYDGILKQESSFIDDEFSLDDGNEEEFEQEQTAPMQTHTKNQCIIADYRTTSNHYTSQQLDSKTVRIGILSEEETILIKIGNKLEARCANCEKKSSKETFYRRAHLGSFFYATTIVPTILEHCPDPIQKDSDGKNPEELPGRGRKLITFTDSRQGTARLALKMQQEAERSKLRGLVFHQLKNLVDRTNVDSPTQENLITLIDQAKKVKEMGFMTAYATIEAQIAEKQAAMNPLNSSISWDDMIQLLSEEQDVKRSILRYNKYANPLLFDSGDNERTIARVLLLREFIRRPKNQNSLETLGLVRVTYKNLETITTAPEYWTTVQKATKYQSEEQQNNTLSLTDWKDYLKVILDFYVRENSFIRISDSVKHWMGMRFYPKSFLPPDSHSDDSSSLKKWPTFTNRPFGLRNRMVKLLIEATNLEFGSQRSKDLMNLFLENAWKELTRLQILSSTGDEYKLDPSVLKFSFMKEAWVCPITNRLFDTTFCGLTPYLPNKMMRTSYACQKVSLPDFSTFKTEANSIPLACQMRLFCRENNEISILRSRSLWSDISDRTLEGGFYYRTAEHSAQQSSVRLKEYEAQFKKGQVNVLNCSTTMEMGVDIGGLTAVLMNNVPPHPANYLQRTGRAGRRGESQSVAYTLCKQDPHNQRAFSNPLWPFVTSILAPTISSSSKTIIHRHVNSLMLSQFLLHDATGDKENHTLRVGWFFGESPSICELFSTWIDENSLHLKDDVIEIIRGTALSSDNYHTIIHKTQERILDIQRRWVEERERINNKLQNIKDESHKRAVELELTRHESEYLLKELAEKAFLPGYGFSTHVVNFQNYNILDFLNKKQSKQMSREDNIFNYKETPSRSLDIAIREYAPGSTLVIDGRVYRSSGVHIPKYEATTNYAFDIAWECSSCGNRGLFEYAYSNDQDIICPRCGSTISPYNKKLILKPSGFAQDFYEELGNDVSTQKFVRSQKPRVQLRGMEQTLPDPRCGSIQFGEEGSVFYHSSGEFDHGYAICLQCGRAESMTEQDEYPKILRDSHHRPLHGKLQKGSRDKTCSREHVRKNIHLGYAIKTDVVEFFLKNPTTGLWLGSNNKVLDRDIIIATTLAIAIRNAIAENLGISSSEMGYACRLDKELLTNEKRIALQIYDTASGGAGFVKAGIDNINTLLKRAVEQLDCPNDCENVCSHCLAAQDSRIEYNEIDRKLAKNWIEESKFTYFLIDPIELYDIPGPQYCTYGPETIILTSLERASRKGVVTTLSFFFSSLSESCDFHHERFFNRLMNWRYNDQVAIQLNFLKGQKFGNHMQRAISSLVSNGLEIREYQASSEHNGLYLFCQIVHDMAITTLYTSQDENRVPGSEWMNSRNPATWITSNEVTRISSQPLENIISPANFNNSTLITINTQFDGALQNFSQRIKELIVSTNTYMKDALSKERIRKINYSDRYLRSPWTVVLMTEFFRVFCSEHTESITVYTTKNSRSSGPYKIFHDWESNADIKEVTEEWIKYRTSINAVVVVEPEMYDLPHAREMIITWESGATTKLLFDQGFGPWKCSVGTYRVRNFNFSSIDYQVSQLKTKFKELHVQRDEPWETYIMIDHMQ